MRRRSSQARFNYRALISKLGLLLGACIVSIALSGCFLISGPTQSSDSTPDGGNVYVGFVSAEGTQTTVVKTNFPSQELEIYLLARNDRGQMRIDILDEQGATVFAIEGQAEESGRRGTVRTNAAGEFRYRVRATGAQRGAFQILYQPTGG